MTKIDNCKNESLLRYLVMTVTDFLSYTKNKYNKSQQIVIKGHCILSIYIIIDFEPANTSI